MDYLLYPGVFERGPQPLDQSRRNGPAAAGLESKSQESVGCVHREGQRRIRGPAGEPGIQRLLGINHREIARMTRVFGPQLLKQAEELHLAVKLLERCAIRLLRLQLLELPNYRYPRIDSRQFLAQQYLVAMVLEALPIRLALDFASSFECGG